MKVPRPLEKRLLLNECHQNKRQSVDLRNEMLWSDHSMYIRTVISKLQLSVLLNFLKIVYEPF